MKTLLTCALLALNINAFSQNKGIMLGVKNKSQYQGEKTRETWFTGANSLGVRTKFSGTQIEITGFNKIQNATFFVLDPPEPLLLEVTEFDIGNDGRKEIIVAYTPEVGKLYFKVYDSRTFKYLGGGIGSEYLRFVDNKVVAVFEHQAGEELNFYTIKGGKLVEVGTN